MDGKLKKIKNAQNEYMYPITVSDAVYVDPETSLKTKLAELDANLGNPNSYVIELDKWGIHSDGSESAATTKGINDALSWAKSSGYNHVLLPSGTYSLKIDPNGIAIYMLSGIHFEMKDDCVLQLEGNSSPSYRIIHFDQIDHAKVSGGTIIGDKASHQYEMYVKFVRGGVNADGSLNDNPNFIRSEVIDRYQNPGLLSTFRLWSINGITTTTYSFYQYKDSVSKDTLVNFRTNGEFAPAAPTGRGWFDTIDQDNKMVFVIDITSSPLTNEQISQISAKVDNSYYTHEGGYGVAVFSSNYIEVQGIEISNCTGDGIFVGISVRYEDPSQYTQEEMGQHIYIHGCDIHHCRRQGMSLCGSNDVFVANNTIHHIGYADDGVTTDFRNGTAPMFGIDVESMVGESNIPYKSIYLNQDGLETNYRIYIYNNYIHHNAKGHFVNADGTQITLQNNTFEAYNVGAISSYPNQWYIKYLNNTFIQCTLVVKGNNVVNGGVFNKANLNLMDVQGALIDNCQIKDGLFYGSSIYGYFGMPSAVNIATGTFAYTAPHGMGNGAQICFEQWFGKVPTGISVDKVYYTVNITSTSFQVSETKGGSPVMITDAGVTGFNISRYNYGRCYISNITVETDWNDTTGSKGFNTLVAGAVIHNVTVKNCPVSIKAPDNYVGRPNVIVGLTLLESGGNLQASDLSNLKVMKVRTKALGGDLTLGSTTAYSRVNIDSGLFQGIQVNFEEAYLNNGTFINAIVYKQDHSNRSILSNSYLENTSLSLHWLTMDKSMIITKCLFNNVTVDASSSVKMIDNVDVNSGLSDNRMNALPVSGKYTLGQIIYNSTPKPGGYVGWICTTGGYATNQAWAASKAFSLGYRIQSGGHVYEVTTAGTSGSVPPVFPTSSGSTITDNTIVWKEIGLLAVFNNFGPIST
ncbi:right-handed parallel beta-helix repeat-containing protein [Paenibacillus sp. UNC451MF]|uniref:right-handed parallel beta-helix repeat-containing protein n=1 Tax=Paenibacillus sp. UNC451MF TaxID=1449063 RepID=UPI00068FEBF9|nr:right-handed parallel beta-helix repeat-containing protein [Paenibacillus sp. UNC451MF]